MNLTKVSINNTERNWILFDAESKVLGRLSTEVATTLLGKCHPQYRPGCTSSYGVIIINAEKITVTGKKKTDKFYYKHSGTPGGMTIESFKEIQQKNPAKVIQQSIKRMLPKTSLGRQAFTKLKIYSGPIHPHFAQKPIPYSQLKNIIL